MKERDYIDMNITIEGLTYSWRDFFEKKTPPVFLGSEFHFKLYEFLKEWYSDIPMLNVKTSGSTGRPKEMKVSKQRMLQSARLTCRFLELKAGDKVLLCMPIDFIAGKMIVVRALFAGLDLFIVPPCGHPLSGTDINFDFAAMIPLQVFNSMNNEKEKLRLSKIKSLIIGGGSIDTQLENMLKEMPNAIYSTYGMTETLSHIALRRLNGINASEYYTPVSSVSLSLDDDGALIIDAPLVSDKKLYTNDIAEINEEGNFIIKGRRDNIINSGGIKIQPEIVEQELKSLIGDIPFAISSLPDEKLGEKPVLVIEKNIDESIFNNLPKYHKPRQICIDSIPLTETGKINRKQLKENILNKNI